MKFEWCTENRSTILTIKEYIYERERERRRNNKNKAPCKLKMKCFIIITMNTEEVGKQIRLQ